MGGDAAGADSTEDDWRPGGLRIAGAPPFGLARGLSADTRFGPANFGAWGRMRVDFTACYKTDRTPYAVITSTEIACACEIDTVLACDPVQACAPSATRDLHGGYGALRESLGSSYNVCATELKGVVT